MAAITRTPRHRWVEEGLRALAFSLVIGHHFMAADHGPRSHDDVLELAVRWLLA